MQQMLQNIIQTIERTYPVKDLGDVVELYRNLPEGKTALYLAGLKNADEILPHIENVAFSQAEIEKGALIFLAALNIYFEREAQVELRHITNLLLDVHLLEQKEIREKILYGYIIVGLNLFRNFAPKEAIVSDKIILSELHSSGVFQPGIWGISVDLNLLAEVLKNIKGYSDEKVTRLVQKHSSLRLEELSLLARLAA